MKLAAFGVAVVTASVLSVVPVAAQKEAPDGKEPICTAVVRQWKRDADKRYEERVAALNPFAYGMWLAEYNSYDFYALVNGC